MKPSNRGPDSSPAIIVLTHAGERTVRAELSQAGAGVRALVIDGVETVQRHTSVGRPPYSAGLTLAPWPNRVRGGLWEIDGRARQLELSEEGRSNAIHGLVQDVVFEVVHQAESTVWLQTIIGSQPGWQAEFELTVEYQVNDDGLAVRYTARNLGAAPSPFAIGAHPFFIVGSWLVDELLLTVPANEALYNDDAGIPVRRESVSGPDDLRGGSMLEGLHLAQCYTSFSLSSKGRIECYLTAPDGVRVRVWSDPVFGFWQVFTAEDFPGAEAIGRAIALEPMTAPGDALNSGIGLIWLSPDEIWTGEWGIMVDLAS